MAICGQNPNNILFKRRNVELEQHPVQEKRQ
jgi:hypothetical protein